jgi:hypothetical protein
MIAVAAGACGAAWLAVIGAVAGLTGWRRPAPGRSSLALRGEPPAVVSLLARRPDADGYAATLLDLAARGWVSLAEEAPGRVVCRLPPGLGDGPGAVLTDYERRALAHVAFRSGDSGSAPGAALGSGFAVGEREFRTRFGGEVRADARRLGLIRRRLGPGPAAVLAAAGLPAVALAVLALPRPAGPAAWPLLGLGYLAVAAAVGWLSRGLRMTPAGRAALAGWLGFRAAITGSHSRPTAGTALLAADGDRRIGYAAALGAAPAATAAFRAEDQQVWSSYQGTWRQVSIGRPRRPLVPGVAARLRRLPARAEFDGVILRRWTEAGPACGGGSGPVRCLAIDDGERDQAWVLTAAEPEYEHARTGMVVHVTADPRRGRLLALAPVPR